MFVLVKNLCRGAWVAQSVDHLTLDLGSGPDLGVTGSSPKSGSALSEEFKSTQ